MYKSNPERELHCSDCLLKIKHIGTLVEPHLFSRAPSKPLEYIPHDPALLWPMSPHACLGGNVADMSQHVGDDTNVSLQFWPDGSVSPTLFNLCHGSLCRLEPTFTRFSEVRM